MGSLGAETAKKTAMWQYPKVLGFNPSERWGHSACFSGRLMYIFGGCCGGLLFSDVLTLDLDKMAWCKLVTTGEGPGPRDSHSSVLVGHKMIVFGGTNGLKKVNDVHILDLVTKEWVRPECEGTPPPPRESHTATLVGGERLVIFGGSGEGDANYLNDLHILDLRSMRWTSPEPKGDLPVPRDSHCALAIGNKLFVYGGDSGDQYHGSINTFDMDTMTWSRLTVQGCSPGVRAGHAAVSIGTKVYIIGGVGDKRYYSDVWVFDLCTCSWTQLDISGPQPQGRFSHTAVFADMSFTIYGGCGEDERPLNELLVLQLGAEHPNGRHNISLCKNFGNYWNQGKRPFPGGSDAKSKTILMGNNLEVYGKVAYEFESERSQRCHLDSDTPQQKRKRKVWDVESEQEEHSLSLSQHSSPSQSDQEQTPCPKANDAQRFLLFKHLNQSSPQNIHFVEHQQKQEQYVYVHENRGGVQLQGAEQKSIGQRPIQHTIGAEVRGKVDGAFDSGLLMTATVNGRIFRGVLFAPGAGVVGRGSSVEPSSIPCIQPFMSSDDVNAFRAEWYQCHGSGHTQVTPPISSLSEEQRIRSDLQGLVLTLGRPANVTHAGSHGQ